MQYLVTAIHITACLILIGVVLLQTGKRADLAGAFGGGGSQTAFGTRGAATLLSKLTTSFAVLFMLTSIGLSIISSRTSETAGTVLEDVDQPASSAPAPTDGGADLPALPPLPEETPGDNSDDESGDTGQSQ